MATRSSLSTGQPTHLTMPRTPSTLTCQRCGCDARIQAWSSHSADEGNHEAIVCYACGYSRSLHPVLPSYVGRNTDN